MSDMAIEIFKTGRHSREITAEALQKSVAAYDPSLHKAPLVIGHPKGTDPAYGWADSIAFSDDTLTAEVSQVEENFAESVNSGRYPNRSVSFYRPDSPANPVPGVFYIRHIGFLGAQAPAVKGMKAVNFSEGETEADLLVIDFSESIAPYTLNTLGRVLRGLRDWVIGEKDLETADRIIPSYAIDELTDEAARLRHSQSKPYQFNENNQLNHKTGEQIMTPEEIEQKTADFAEQQSKLDAKQADLDARQEAIDAAALEQRKQGAINFCEQMATEGRLLPRDQAPMAEVLAQLDQQSTVINFSENYEGEAAEGNAADYLRQHLKSRPVIVNFKEIAGGDDAGVVNFSDEQVRDLAQAYINEQAVNGKKVSVTSAVAHIRKANNIS